MDENQFRVLIGVVIAVLLFLIGVIVGVGAGVYVVPSLLSSTTTTSTTTSTTTTTVSTTTTSTIRTTTTSSTTTTLEPFYVCMRELSRTEFVETRCYSKNEKEYYNASMKSKVDYVLNNTVIGEYSGNRAKVREDECHYVAEDISFSVGAFSTCEIPQERDYTMKAEKPA
jgi:E3 ubiquitin-protein ligase DOA10